MNKKVLILTQNFYPVVGSAGNRMKNIFELLNEHDVQTDVVTIEPSYPNKKCIAIISIGMMFLIKITRELRE
ncbi:hypothetical protein [Halolactibacillus sp. JCM 19043]|uniref:hypothetical protein n=1 Tax=Halolactibacillus sp. JCM 19043 TaxID=1460638 RepID=UPI000783123F|nr:hypothetical protein [Halolactibacillus sp. JCM 19043]